MGRVLRWCALAVLLAACEGPMGPPGPAGGAGLLDGGGTLPDAGASADAAFAPDAQSPTALTGAVRGTTGTPVGGGRVLLIPRERVARLAETPIDATLSGAAAALARNDEPLEDLFDEPDLAAATVGADGRFALDSVPEGSFFVVYAPAAGDEVHLPGGQLARAPIAGASLRGARIDLEVSSAPSPAARYVGNTTCLGCHARHTTFASAHALTLRVPGRSTPQQDVGQSARIDEALAAFRAGTRLYVHDCGATPGCRVATQPPPDPTSVRLTITLGVDASVADGAVGRYFVVLARGGVEARHPVALTLGGARTAQQYAARSALPGGGFTHFVLPFTFQLAGDASRADARDQPWVAYRVDDWVDDVAPRLPAHAQAFERQCAGCHATGFAARGSDAAGYRGSAVADRDGVYDLDGDGRTEQLAVGCEACHGPGSEHLARGTRGERIVAPGLLTPERQALICGQCHARHAGTHGELAPLDAQLAMPRAGLARSAFLARHVSRLEESPALRFASGDPRVGFMQYGDFVRSAKYRNADLLVTCSDCHDAHRSAGFALDLRDADGNAACAGCHAQARAVTEHAAGVVGYAHDRGVDPADLTCTRCHMVRTATSGARTPALVDRSGPGAPFTYLHGDRATHRYVFEGRARLDEQPVAATDACAGCHGTLFITP